MRISDWSSDVCSSDLREAAGVEAVLAVKAGQLAANLLGEILRLDRVGAVAAVDHQRLGAGRLGLRAVDAAVLEHAADHPVAPRHRGLVLVDGVVVRSEEHTSELQSLMRISYAVFCLEKKKNQITHMI